MIFDGKKSWWSKRIQYGGKRENDAKVNSKEIS